MAGVRWFIARNNEKVGPFTAPELQQMARVGLLAPEEHVWVEGAEKWLVAGSLPGLFPKPAEKKYWLTWSGRTRGPFVADQIRTGLNAHQFNLDTLACTDDDRRWTPLRDLADFRDFQLETVPLTPSRAQQLVGTLEFEEAALHLAGKDGDILAQLISTFLDMKRNYASNPGLVKTLDYSIAVLRAKRAEA